MSKLTKYIIGVAVAVAVLFVLWYFSNIVAYILTSAVLAIIGKPMVGALVKVRAGRFRFPRWAAALITLAALWAVTVLFFTFFIPLVLGKLGQLAQLDVESTVDAFRRPLASLQDMVVHVFSVSDATFSVQEEIARHLSELFNLDVVNRMLSSIVAVIGNTVVALFSISFITFFFLKEDSLFLNMVSALFPSRYEHNVAHAINSITNLLIRYFTGILAESVVIMLLLGCAFMLWGFPADTAIFMGVVMGVLNVIPYIGPLIGAVICVTVGVVTPVAGFAPGEMATIIACMILGVKMLDDFVLQPALYSNRVNAHPLEIFLVILIAGSMAGVLGMLLAIPAYNVVRVFAKEFFNNYKLVRKLTENI